jgi:hypothetical protein
MEQWGAQHCVFISETFFKNGNSVVKTQWIFHKHFIIASHGKIPCHNTIQWWVENFRTSASALKKKPPGSVSTVQLPQNIEVVRQSFIESPRHSARRHSVALEISNHSMKRILHKDLNSHPYKMVVVQELSDHDMTNCSTVAEHFSRRLSNNVINLMTDEAYFHLSDCVNKQSFHYRAKENPQQLHQQSLRSHRPLFLWGEDGRAVTVTSAHYVAMLWNFLTPELSRCRIKRSTIWFQQDGATVHTARASTEVIQEMFLE